MQIRRVILSVNFHSRIRSIVVSVREALGDATLVFQHVAAGHSLSVFGLVNQIREAVTPLPSV